jgi:predicted transcriptional regulator
MAVEKTKECYIKAEIRKFKKIFKEVEAKKQKVAEGLIEEAAFMRVTLKELKDDINDKGVVDEMQQGDYTILREHPAVKVYNTMIQRYLATTKQMTDLLPKEIAKKVEDDFEDFVGNRDG